MNQPQEEPMKEPKYQYTIRGGGMVHVPSAFKTLNDIYGVQGYNSRLKHELKTAGLSEKNCNKYMERLWSADERDPTKGWHEHNQQSGQAMALSSLFRRVPLMVLHEFVRVGIDSVGRLTGDSVAVDVDMENDAVTLTVVCENLEAALEKPDPPPAKEGE